MGLIALVMMADSGNWSYIIWSNRRLTKLALVILYCYSCRIISIMIGMKYIQNVSELTRPKVDYPSILYRHSDLADLCIALVHQVT